MSHNVPRPDLETEAFLRMLAEAGDPPLPTLTAQEARALVIGAVDTDSPRPAAEIEDIVIPGGSSGSVPLRIVRPEGATGTLPVVLYLHGGGWVLGDVTEYDHLIRSIAHRTGAAVVFVDYTLCPEVRFPIANEQSHVAAAWVAEHGAEHGLDGSRLVVAGDSAGGNMAAVVSLLAKERGGPEIALQALIYPVTNCDFGTESYRLFGSGHYLSTEEMRWFWDHYMPDEAARIQPLASPLRASLDDLKGLPPAVVITCELDVLRDEGEAYARRLMEAGVPVAATRYVGAIHGCLTIPGVRDNASSKAMLAQLYSAIRGAVEG
ncbi:MAG TPA: alpha/beta hydrolase [Thermomicrobiales bacterium]|nr:alpha/beta hydrolase [Thermomicrobiales bacterium]